MKMNLTQFLKRVDGLADSCEKEQLTVFIHETARLLEEKDREEFLDRLEDAASGAIKKCGAVDDGSAEEYDSVSQALAQIEEGELLLDEEYNDEYDEWYDSMEEEFLYTDPDGICKILEDACIFVHKCVDQCMYQKGADIGRRLFLLEICVASEYGSEDFTLEDMRDYHLLYMDLKSVALDTLYCMYCSCRMEDRPEALYDLIYNSGLRDLGMEDLMQHGSGELQDFETFLDQWIRFLSDKADVLSKQLFLEAVSLKDDAGFSVELARTSAGTHPELCLELLRQNQYSSEETWMEFGLDALNLIDRADPIRSEVALMTADRAVKRGKEDIAEMCYLESFRSSPQAVHYLRALLNSRDAGETRRKLDQIWEEAPKSGWKYYGDYDYGVEFLTGNFRKVLTDKKGMNLQDALGWSGSFMKEGFALFSLYLYEGTDLLSGMKRMVETASFALEFTAENYRKGLGKAESGKENGNKDKEVFYSCFMKWKALTPVDKGIADQALRRMEKMVETRVTGIMDTNKRKYYGECAAFIAALGEVEESRGETGRKQSLMKHYKEKYNRRWAFRDELRKYGFLL